MRTEKFGHTTCSLWLKVNYVGSITIAKLVIVPEYTISVRGNMFWSSLLDNNVDTQCKFCPFHKHITVPHCPGWAFRSLSERVICPHFKFSAKILSKVHSLSLYEYSLGNLTGGLFRLCLYFSFLFIYRMYCVSLTQYSVPTSVNLGPVCSVLTRKRCKRSRIEILLSTLSWC